MPAIHSNRITRLTVIIGQHWRKLFEHDVGWEFIPLVVVPRLRIQRRILPRTHWVVPLPACERSIRRMIRHQYASCTLRVSLALLKHRKLVGIHGCVFVNSRLHMPADEISPVASREGSRTESADGRTLPITVIDITGYARHARFLERKAERSSPGSFRYCVSSPSSRWSHDENYEHWQAQTEFHFHKSPKTAGVYSRELEHAHIRTTIVCLNSRSVKKVW